MTLKRIVLLVEFGGQEASPEQPKPEDRLQRVWESGVAKSLIAMLPHVLSTLGRHLP
jgi:hypothetical protein